MVRIACLVFLLAAAAANAAAADFNVLDKYARHDAGDRLNTPQDEIAWLKNQFKHGELKDFPARAIILHRADVEKYLKAAGFGGFYTSFTFGFTDPKVIYIVRKPGTTPFAVARGLPGAGGVTLLAGMLHAMGTISVIHVGTCGLLSPEVPYGRLIISDGSYRDGAAFLLDDRPGEQISRPDAALTRQIAQAAAHGRLAHVRATGFTMPVYFYQPASVVRDLLAITGPDRPGFIEMEQAPLFSIARHMGMRAASIVVGSDRLETRDGKLAQGYWKGDLDALELSAFRLAVKVVAAAR